MYKYAHSSMFKSPVPHPKYRSQSGHDNISEYFLSGFSTIKKF
jgi:hypothetical protein